MQEHARDDLRYCRDVEAYLCRRNGGHLVRIVGPAFALVRGWAEAGVPLTIVERAIDTCCERREARRSAARPLRIEFCEAEVREQFERWRRAIGPYIGVEEPAGADGAASSDGDAPAPGLASHLARAGERLARAAARLEHSEAFRGRLDAIIAALDEVRTESKGARGERRAAFVERLARMDDALMTAARDEAVRAGIEPEVRASAAKELTAWRERMPAETWSGAVAAAAGRLLRDRYDLPDLTL